MSLFGNKIKSLLSTDRISNLIKYSNVCNHLGGYLAEFGVYAGGSLEIMARFNPGVEIIGVDSFEGVPPASEYDIHQEGDFGGVNARNLIGYFSMVYSNVRVMKGVIPKIFEAFDDNARFSFSHIDLDMHDSVRHACDFVFPRTLTGGMILFDDYRVNSTPGATKAIEDFFEDKECTFNGELFYYEGGPSHKQYLCVV